MSKINSFFLRLMVEVLSLITGTYTTAMRLCLFLCLLPTI